MKKRLIALSAVLTACTAAPTSPAIGETNEITNVYFPPETVNAEIVSNFAESPPALVLRAEEGGVTCDSVTLLTPDGASHEIFSGAVGDGESVRAAVPGDVGSFVRIALACRADGPPRACLLYRRRSP